MILIFTSFIEYSLGCNFLLEFFFFQGFLLIPGRIVQLFNKNKIKINKRDNFLKTSMLNTTFIIIKVFV